MGKQKLTSKTYVHLPDGRVLPVSTVHDAGGDRAPSALRTVGTDGPENDGAGGGGDVGLLQRADGQAITQAFARFFLFKFFCRILQKPQDPAGTNAPKSGML